LIILCKNNKSFTKPTKLIKKTKKAKPISKAASQLRDIQHPMNLQGKPPCGMAFHGLDAGFHVGLALLFILAKTWLQETVFCLNVIILRQVLTQIDDLQLIATLHDTRRCITTFKCGFRRKRHPIEVRGQWMRTVCFDGDGLACLLLQFGYKSLVDEQGRLASREHDKRGNRIFIRLIHNLLQRHHRSILMLRITEMAAQVAPAEAHENSGRTSMEAFPLEGVEYFIDLVHGLLFSQNPQNSQNND